jgi:hypothetical protein
VFSAASYVGDAGGHKSVIAPAGGPFCLGRRRPAGNVASGVPDPRPKGEVIATEFVVRGRREGGAPGTRCSMPERASSSVSPEAADIAADSVVKRARPDAGAYTQARATAAPRRRSGGELEFNLAASKKARAASMEMSVRAARPPTCLPARSPVTT